MCMQKAAGVSSSETGKGSLIGLDGIAINRLLVAVDAITKAQQDQKINEPHHGSKGKTPKIIAVKIKKVATYETT